MSKEVADVSIKDNSNALLKEMERACLAALHAVGQQAVKHMVEKVPYDTGLLRNSLTYALDGEAPEKQSYKADRENGKIESGTYSGTTPKERGNNRAVYIGTNVPYAIYQEYGTQKSNAQPFMRPAVTEYTDEYKKIIEEYINIK